MGNYPRLNVLLKVLSTATGARFRLTLLKGTYGVVHNNHAKLPKDGKDW